MVKRRLENETETCHKRPTASPLTRLPAELKNAICDHLPKRDIRTVSLVSHDLRHAACDKLFGDFYLTWDTLAPTRDYLASDTCGIAGYIHTLHITKHSSYAEWHYPELLSEFMALCPQLANVTMVISGSSAWLKYVRCDRVTNMTVVSGQVQRLQTFNNVNAPAKQISFDIDHLVGFPAVKTLTLEGFTVQRDSILNKDGVHEIIPLSRISAEKDGSTPVTRLSPTRNETVAVKRLVLENCIWQYPYDVKDFGSIEELEVRLSRGYTVYSHNERFHSFVLSPPPTVKRLTIDLPVEPYHQQLSWTPLKSHRCKQLEYLSIKGFHLPGIQFAAALPASLKQLRFEVGLTQDKEMFHRLDAQADSYRDTFTASTRARSLDVELVGVVEGDR
ncbi:hypothetical protein CJU89_5516 [Yarrowia sp. B02]|nr:hypothetical protein CJU89_5516 [Yarrowia sp. B02]